MKHWTAADIPDQTGKTALVTGANSGLGLETALALAARGAQVVMACRDPGRAQRAMQALRAQVPEAQLAFMPLDLADLRSVRQLAMDYGRRFHRLDMLCNNAGVMALPQRRTADGFEMQFGTNHLGHFALTALLWPVLQRTPGARVVHLSSGFHWCGRIRLHDLQREHGYTRWPAYCQSKLAVLMFSFELDRRLRKLGAPVLSTAAHPGYASTNLQFAGPAMAGSGLARQWGRLSMAASNWLAAQPARTGALPTLYAATAPGVEGGSFFGPRFVARGHPAPARASARARDEAVARELWRASERLVGLSFLD